VQLSEEGPLAGQVAIVTGASRGIGRAIASRLAQEGAAVAVNFRNAEGAALSLVEEIEARRGRAIAVQADVSDSAASQQLVETTLAKLGAVDILINNAGTARNRLVFEMQESDWMGVMRVNFGGVFNCTSAVIEHMSIARRGAIVNISSILSERAWVGAANYIASKAAINAYTRACALELGRFGVRVNAVLPGLVETDLVKDLLARERGRMGENSMRQEFVTPEQVAAAVAFLCGPDATGITGCLLIVDGGSSPSLRGRAPR
jgi:3-oxoacyl-[acyl-carrier protein] reductase